MLVIEVDNVADIRALRDNCQESTRSRVLNFRWF